MTIAVYPGSFDPVTNGHIDIATRASILFDRFIIAVYDTPPKNLLFTTQERVRFFQEAIAQPLPGVEVISFSGLVVDLARRLGARAIVRGLRMGSDFEREFEMALMNRCLIPEIEVVCLMSRIEYQFLSSSLLKEVASLGGSVAKLVPPNVLYALRERFPQLRETLASRGG